jgi:nitroreductase/dihydropteridine reductase
MTPDELTHLVRTRHTCKAFDPTRQIPPSQVAALLDVLRHAPSSVNSQPWHFIVAASASGKTRLTQGFPGVYAYNAPKVLNASHTVVLCRRTGMDDAHFARVLDQEDADGRFSSGQAKETARKSRAMYLDMHHKLWQDTGTWMDKQVYIALGMLLQSAALLGIDACPMEGFDQSALDQALGLPEQGLTAVVLVALGYRSADDFNAALPKSRLEPTQLFTHL